MLPVVLFLVSVLSLPPFQPPGAASKEESLRRTRDSIRPMVVYEYCRRISSAEFSGRLTGDSGYTAAARWAARKFGDWGLMPADRASGFLQPFPSPCTRVESASMTIILDSSLKSAPAERTETRVPLVCGRDFLPLLFTDSGEGTGSAMFVGWGIHAPELGYDDYAAMEVKNRFLLCFRGTPDPSDPRFQYHDEHRTRMKIARERGALGLIYIRPSVEANPNGEWTPRFLPAMISESVADRMFSEKEITSAQLLKDLVLYRRPISFPLRSRIEYRARSRHFPEAVGYNVAGFIEGADPVLKKDCLVLGAHYDGCGSHVGVTFSGADDNASGSAVVMAVAEAMARAGRRPKRSILFVLFGGEEMGLLGSSYFADHLPESFRKVDAMFNFDMEGEGDKASVSLTADPLRLKTALEAADASLPVISEYKLIKDVGVRSSDFAPFFRKGIPCASFSSNGPHIEYHKAGDTIYRINPDILGDISRLAFASAYEWADRDRGSIDGNEKR